jgi:sec-independent protein translocase protein TatA
MPGIGPMELIVVLVIALLVLGPKKLPEVGRSVGRGIREFRSSVSGGDDGEPGDGAAAPPVPAEPPADAEPIPRSLHRH